MSRGPYDIAIVGISCRLPGANSIHEYWEMLKAGQSGITDIPKERWDAARYYDEDPMQPGKMSARKGGYIQNIHEFDAAFFGIAPKEAESIDPQQRLMLELTWEALEDAGILPGDIKGTDAGVFIGSCSNDFSTMVFNHPADHPYAGTGTTNCIIANRVSYVYDLKGPSISYDAACASSLVAILEACKSIREGEAKIAITGGVHITLLPGVTVSFSKSGLISKANICRPFDNRADGYLRSEGAGVMILKSLEQAQKDGDEIYAVIKGGAVNHNGKSNGLSAPNPQAQEALLQKAYECSGIILANDIAYIEAQGIGTRFGDALELKAIGNSLSRLPGKREVCKVGSVKSNIGHTEAASGMLSIIKMALASKHGCLPAIVNYEQPNEMADLKNLGLEIQTTYEAWPAARPYAGISAFGFGGVNAHVIVGKINRAQQPENNRKTTPFLLALSAKSETSLQAQCAALARYIEQNKAADLEAICYHINKRTPFKCRVAIVATTRQEAIDKLRDYRAGDMTDGLIKEKALKKAPSVVFMYTGNNSHYKDMGKELYDTFPVFKNAFDHCDQIASGYLDKSLRDIIYGSEVTVDVFNEIPEYYHTAIFAIEYALVELWKHWGILPSVVTGTSLGEFAAACVAGVFTPEDAIYMVYNRAVLFKNLPKNGSTIVAFAGYDYLAEKIKPYGGKITFAAFNGPKYHLMAGYKESVQELTAQLEADLVRVFTLYSPVAYHCFLIEPIREQWLEIIGKVTFHKPAIPYVSNVTGDYCTDEVCNPEYWYRHSAEPVYFQKSMEAIRKRNYDIFLEIGPKPITIAMGADVYAPEKKVWLPSINMEHGDVETILKALSTIFVYGGVVNWNNYFLNSSYPKQAVPAYQFDRQYYWPKELSLKPVISGHADGLSEKLLSSGQFTQEQVDIVLDILQQQDGTTVQPVAEHTVKEAQTPVNIVEQLAGKDHAAQSEVLFNYLVTVAAQVLRLKKENIAPDATLFGLGMDSLMGIEIRERIQKELKVEIEVALLMEAYTVRELAAKIQAIFSRYRNVTDVSNASLLPVSSEIDFFGNIETLSTSELDTLLKQLKGDAKLSDIIFAGNNGHSVNNDAVAMWVNNSGNLSQKQKIAYAKQLLTKKLSSEYVVCSVAENQKALWHIWHTNPTDHSYNLAFAIKINSPVNLELLRQALQVVYNRHDELRASFFYTEDAGVRQRIPGYAEVFFETVSTVGLNDAEVHQLVTAKHHEPFDLEHGPLLKAYAFTSDTSLIFLLNIHHIVIDGASYWILLNECKAVYEALLKGQPVNLPAKPKAYDGFVQRQAAMLNSEHGQEMERYWTTLLDGTIEDLALPTDRQRSANRSFNGGSVEFSLPGELGVQLQQLAKQESVSLFVILLAGFQALLHRFSGRDRILVGSPFAGRSNSDLSKTVGYFVNSIVLNAVFNGKDSFRDLLLQMRQKVNDAIKYGDYPFSLLVSKLNIQRDPLRTPVFQAMFDLAYPKENDELRELFADRNAGRQTQWGDWQVEPYGIVNEAAQFDVSLRIYSSRDQLTGFFKYNADIFDQSSVERLLEGYIEILKAAVADAASSVVHMSLLAPAMREKMLYEWNRTGRDFPLHKLLHEVIDSNAQVYINKIAATCGSEQITYNDLVSKANKLAGFLMASGVKPGDFVPVLLGRSIDMLVSILAIFKAGAVYMPLDKNYPFARIYSILEETGAKVVISKGYLSQVFEEVGHTLPGSFREVLLLDDTHLFKQVNAVYYKEDQYKGTTPEIHIAPDDLCYMIYTSGSTGKPKGVMVQHKGMLNHLFAKADDLQLNNKSIIVQNASQCFDISIWQFFAALVTGGHTVIIPDEQLLDIPRFLQTVQEQQVTVLEVVPSYLDVVLDETETKPEVYRLYDLKYLVVTGEALKPRLVNRWFGRYTIPLVNAYGPTEASDDITHYIMCGVVDVPVIPIGKPVANMNIYIVDANGQPCPVGVKGEIWVSGVGVGKGYYKDEAKTQKVFITDPFSKIKELPLFKTGDIGSYLPDGNIQFWGRRDTQVKLKGFRIELEEIEHTLTKIAGVRNAVATIAEENGMPSIAAYLHLSDRVNFSLDEARGQVEQALPYYMVPAHYVLMDAFPVNANGKVDRNKLPKPVHEPAATMQAWTPADDKEKILLEVWKKVLNASQVDGFTSFFSLGGDSITSIQVASKAKAKGLLITPAQLFEFPTIKKLAAVAQWIEKATSLEVSVITEAPLTPIQQWLFKQDAMVHNSYCMALRVNIPLAISDTILNTALHHIISQHPQLKAAFPGKNKQLIADDAGDILDVVDCSTLTAGQYTDKIHSRIRACSNAFNVEQGQLFKAILLKSTDKQELLLVSHHLVTDQLSWDVILTDLQYACMQLPSAGIVEDAPVSASYMEWAVRLNEYAKEADIVRSAGYWIDQHMPAAETAPARYEHSEHASATLDRDHTHKLLHDIHHVYNTNVQDMLLVALLLAVHKTEQKSAFAIELENNGRNMPFSDILDISGTVGWFTAQYPLKLAYQGKDMDNNIRWVKEQLRNVPHNGLSYGLLKYCNNDTTAKLAGLATPGILFNYLGKIDGQEHAGDWQMQQENTERICGLQGVKEHAREFNIFVTDGCLKVLLTYDKQLYAQKNINAFLEIYLEQVKGIISYCSNETGKKYTVSDFKTSKLKQKELDSLLKGIK